MDRFERASYWPFLMCLLLTVLYLLASGVDCVVSRTVTQLLTCDMVACVLSWCQGILNVSFVLR